MSVLPQTRSCFACGRDNARGLNLKITKDGNDVRTIWVPRTEHVGFNDTVHGGILATVLDEMMAWACGVFAKSFAYSVEISIRYSSVAKPGEEVECSGELVANRRNRLFETKAELRNSQGESICSATGKYFPVRPEVQEKLWNDFVGDVTQLKDALNESDVPR